MPLFGKPDEAEKRFKEAEHYGDANSKEFDPDRAIRLLEEATMLKSDKKKYQKELNKMREFMAIITTSSTPQNPRAKDVYLSLLSKAQVEDHVVLKQKGEANFVSVTLDKKWDLVAFSYPYREKPERLISNLGIPLPTGYKLSDCEEGEAVCSVPKCSPAELADLVEVLFTQLLGTPVNYVVYGWIC